MAERTTQEIRDAIRDDIAWLKFVSDVEHDQRSREDEDLGFQNADGAWPKDIKGLRQAMPENQALGLPATPGQPTLSVASLDEPIALVSSQERKAHLGVTIHPLNEDASDDTAKVIMGLYRNIETDSHAQNTRSWGYQRSLWAGRGVYRVNKVYDPEGGHPFDQKIVIKRILFQSHVYLDPFAQEPDWSDGLKAMVIEDIPWPTYKKRYKKSRLARAQAEALTAAAADYPEWVRIGEENEQTTTIRIAEVWRVEITQRKLVLLKDGNVDYEDNVKADQIVTGDDARWMYEDERKVFWKVINCEEELEEEQEWDGQYIPLIPTIGRELQPVKGKRQWLGMVANAKDAVRLTNYAASSAVKMAALETLAPYTLDPKQIEGYEAWWNQSNTRAWPYLPHHKQIDGQTFDPPQRTQADMSKLGPSMQLLGMGRDFVQTATATYDPALGKQPTAHRSGRAIVALQDQSTEATSPYLDNLATCSMPYEATVVLDLIPHVYDRPGRIARILDEQDRSSLVMLNAPFVMQQGGTRPQALPNATPEQQALAQQQVQNPAHPAKHYDLNKGRYGVSVQIGKARPSRLAEGSDALSNLMQADPQLVPIIGPEWAKFQDFPGADTVAELLRKMRDHSMPWLAENPQAAAMDPQRLMAENQRLKQMLQQAAQEHQGKVIEQQGKFKIAAMQEQAETVRHREDNEVKLAVAEINALKDKMTFLEERLRLGLQLGHDAGQAALDRGHEARMAAADNQAALVQGQMDARNTALQSELDQGNPMDAAMQGGDQG